MCTHDAPRPFRVCAHLLEREQPYRVRFTGRGTDSELVCGTCETATLDACAACRERACEGGWSGLVGAPGIVEAASTLRFEHVCVEPHTPRFLDVQPIVGGDRARWIGVGADGRLHHWDLDAATTRVACPLPVDVVDVDKPVCLRVSRDGKLAAVANKRGIRGTVIDLEAGAQVLALARDDYHSEHCDFSMAFVERDGRTLLVHAPDWNRLDVVDARTGELLTPRGPTSYTRDEARPPHYLDYFHCRLDASPDGRWIADSGWVWHPVGIVATWSVDAWLGGNVWESEDGPSRQALTQSGYHWDGPLCWLDDARVAVWGYGEDDPLAAAAQIFDARTGALERWFAGPVGELVFDHHLISLGPGAAVWDAGAGTRLAHTDATLAHYHPGAKLFVAFGDDNAVTVTRIVGHHVAASWNTPAVRAVAAAIHDPAELVILGDALELAGCTDTELLAHCRAPGPHGSHRCWALDRLRG